MNYCDMILIFARNMDRRDSLEPPQPQSVQTRSTHNHIDQPADLLRYFHTVWKGLTKH